MYELRAEVASTFATTQPIVLLKEERKEREAVIEFKNKKEQMEKRAAEH